MFNEKSRYRDATEYLLTDRRGRKVQVAAVPPERPYLLLGYHARKQGQRPDHLAAHYLGDPAAFWRICEANDAMLPEVLSEQEETAIPI